MPIRLPSDAPRRTGPRRRGVAVAVIGLAAVVLAALVVLVRPGTQGRPPAGGGAPGEVGPAAGSTLAPPPVPAAGALIGAWVNPTGGGGGAGGAGQGEVKQLPGFERRVGPGLRVLHLYSSWSAPAPVAGLRTLAGAGAVPMLDWACGDADAAVASGADDQLVRAYASALRAYGGPVFLRWFWEMDLPGSAHAACRGSDGPAGYIAAWDHIRTLFKAAGATNVAFVWCPALGPRNTPEDVRQWYPGAASVDWIAADAYDHARTGAGAFARLFDPFLTTYGGEGKPLMVAETGAEPAEQAAFLQGIGPVIAAHPALKAVVYFDAAGPEGDWALDAAGIAALRALLSTPQAATGPLPAPRP